MKRLLLSVLISGSSALVFAGPLHDAAAAGDIVMLKRVFDLEAVDVRDEDERTPLMRAAEAGKSGAVSFLLENGAQVDAVDKRRNTALVLAAAKGHEGVILLLLNAGADIEHHFDRTPLQVAADKGHARAVDLLLSRGAKLKDALKLAAIRGHADTVKIILQSGKVIDPYEVMGEGSAFYHALAQKSADVVKVFLDLKYDLDPYYTSGQALIDKSYLNDIEMVKLLTDGEGRKYINRIPQRGHTALSVAAYQGHSAMVEILLDRGADINLVAPCSGKTALKAAYPRAKNVLSNKRYYNCDIRGPILILASKDHIQVIKTIKAWYEKNLQMVQITDPEDRRILSEEYPEVDLNSLGALGVPTEGKQE